MNFDKILNSSEVSELPYPTEIKTIETLPIELLWEIFSHLNDRDLQSTSGVNHKWSHLSISVAMHYKFSSIRSFALFLIENLSEEIYPEERKELFSLKNYIDNLNPSNKKQVKLLVPELEENFLFILKDLEDVDLTALKKIPIENNRNIFSGIPDLDAFDLAKLYKRINYNCPSIPNPQSQNDYNKMAIKIRDIAFKGQRGKDPSSINKSTKQKIFENTAKLNPSEITAVYKKVKEYQEDFDKDFLLDSDCSSVSTSLIEGNYIEMALKIANARGIRLEVIANKLFHDGNVDKAVGISQLIRSEDKDNFLRGITRDLRIMGNIEKAIEIAKKISTGSDSRDLAFHDIFINLNGNFGGVMMIINALSEDDDIDLKDSILWEFTGLLILGDFKKFFELRYQSHPKKVKGDIIWDLSKELSQIDFKTKHSLWKISKSPLPSDRIEQAIEHAQAIQRVDRKDDALWGISLGLVLKGYFDKGIEVAYTIPNNQIRRSTVMTIINLLKFNGYTYKAMEVLTLSYFKLK